MFQILQFTFIAPGCSQSGVFDTWRGGGGVANRDFFLFLPMQQKHISGHVECTTSKLNTQWHAYAYASDTKKKHFNPPFGEARLFRFNLSTRINVFINVFFVCVLRMRPGAMRQIGTVLPPHGCRQNRTAVTKIPSLLLPVTFLLTERCGPVLRGRWSSYWET